MCISRQFLSRMSFIIMCLPHKIKQILFFHNYLANILCSDGPWTDFPLSLQVALLPYLTHNPCWCGKGELDAIFGQVQIIQSVFLTRYTGQWSIDKNLQEKCISIFGLLMLTKCNSKVFFLRYGTIVSITPCFFVCSIF